MLAVRPLDAPQLGHHSLQELEKPTALLVLGAARATAAVAAHAARAASAGRARGPVVVGYEVIVVAVEVGRRRFLVARRELGGAEVARRGAGGEVELLLGLRPGIGLDGRLTRARAAVAALGESLRAPFGLALLRALSLLGHCRLAGL